MTEIPGDFESFWRVYPRRTAKAAAQKVWDKLMKMGVSSSAILSGVERYAAAKRGTDTQYIAHPSTWLGQQRWLDEDAATITSTGNENTPRDMAAVELLAKNAAAREIKKKLITKTRWEHWAKIESAAARIKVLPAELWNCMLPGEKGLERLAWGLACADVFHSQPAPEFITITREHWLEGKDRCETRARSIAAMRNRQWSPAQPAPIIRSSREAKNEDTGRDRDGSDAGADGTQQAHGEGSLRHS